MSGQSRERPKESAAALPKDGKGGWSGAIAGFARRIGPRAEAAPAPHPAMALFAAPAAAGASGTVRGGRYEDIKAQLRADAKGLDTEEVAKARKFGGVIGQAMLDRLIATRISDNLFWVSRVFVLFFFLAFVWFAFQAGMRRPAVDFGYASLVFFVAFLVAVFLEGLFRVEVARARRTFDAAADNLEEVVRLTTGRFRDDLVPRRARMQAGSGARDALTASAEARLLTAGALRFFDQAPFIGVSEAGMGHTCGNVTAALRAAGLRTSAMSDRFAVNSIIAVAGAVVGGALLLFSLSDFSWRGIPPALKSIVDFGAARPVAALSVVCMIGLLLTAMIPGFLAAQFEAARAPGRVLSREPVKTLANNMHLRLLQAAAEQQREFIERYADALIALETRSSGWGADKGHHASHGESRPDFETPSWRRKPEGPRFVDTAFQATPKAFLMGPEGAAKAAAEAGKTAPKRRLFDRLKPPGA